MTSCHCAEPSRGSFCLGQRWTLVWLVLLGLFQAENTSFTLLPPLQSATHLHLLPSLNSGIWWDTRIIAACREGKKREKDVCAVQHDKPKEQGRKKEHARDTDYACEACSCLTHSILLASQLSLTGGNTQLGLRSSYLVRRGLKAASAHTITPSEGGKFGKVCNVGFLLWFGIFESSHHKTCFENPQKELRRKTWGWQMLC